VYIERRRYGGVAVIKLIGRLEDASSERVRRFLGRLITPNGSALLDFTKTSYLSGAGLRALLLSCRKAEAMGTAIALGGLPAEVRGAMAANGLLDQFTVANSAAAGIDVLARWQRGRPHETGDRARGKNGDVTGANAADTRVNSLYAISGEHS
jgi:anti-anti-sigma factor